MPATMPARRARANGCRRIGPPAARCTWHHASDEGLVTVYPDVYRTWARDDGLAGDPERPGGGRRRAGTGAASGGIRDPDTRRPETSDLTIVRPLGGALFLLDTTLRREFQSVALAARGGTPGPLEWFVDEQSFGIDRGGAPLRWPLARGRHHIEVHDRAGHSATTSIDVR